jgi:polysaccharide export outer membrane protein
MNRSPQSRQRYGARLSHRSSTVSRTPWRSERGAFSAPHFGQPGAGAAGAADASTGIDKVQPREAARAYARPSLAVNCSIIEDMLGSGLLILASVGITLPPIKCLVADRFPQIEAVIVPAASKARVFFKGAGGSAYYYVDMVPKVGRFVAKLPKPKEKAGPVTYYIEVVDPTGAKARTQELTAEVVRSAGSCSQPDAVAEAGPSGDVELFTLAASTRKPDAFTGVARINGAEAAVGEDSPLDPPARPARARSGSPPSAAPVSVAPSPAPTASPTAAPVGDYQIGPEDILRITVYGHEDLTQTVVVQSDGTFVFPLIGRVKAGDLTPKELERKITVLLSQGFIRNPQVTVVVSEYRSKTIFVVGEVMRPGTYPLSGSRTLVEALARAGPTTANAAGEVVIVRPQGEVQGPVLPNQIGDGGALAPGQAEVIRVNLRDIQAGDLTKNIALRPNDTVFVPQAPKVFVSGEVRNPGAYPFSPGTTVRQAISLAGGLTEDGSSGRIRVVREVDGKAREVKIRLDEPIQAGDTIVVKSKLF